MKLSAYLKNNFKKQSGFTLLEMLFVICISTLLTAVFLNLIIQLYQDDNFFNLQSDWQLDSYLAVDFITEQIANASRVEVINDSEIHIFTYYDQEYQWLRLTTYQSKGKTNLGRSIGSTDLNYKDFGRNSSLLDNIEELKFTLVSSGLLEVKLILKDRDDSLVVSRIIKI